MHTHWHILSDIFITFQDWQFALVSHRTLCVRVCARTQWHILSYNLDHISRLTICLGL